LDDEGRARVDAGLRPGVETRHHVGVILHYGCEDLARGLRRHQFHKTLRRLGAGLRVIAIEAVQTCSSMGIEYCERRVLLRHVFEHSEQNRVFEHIGMVAGVEGVAVTEHAGMVPRAPKMPNP